ncbi:hypothetical protein BIY27_08660 [Gibbsiella quercinecans]|uniref:hypothetical protein n=1 Tax=Gibbsiella quercinecans TaxID=929813 RepID=UPI000EF1E0E7|nr:hypothetical protein [Gibbsiella quercinecans]RLM14050.1 hypothetical protein BIY27_08660 [Gibbsiella quercinecans]
MSKVKFMEMTVVFSVNENGSISQDINAKHLESETARKFMEKYMKAFVASQLDMVASVSKVVLNDGSNKLH